MNAPSFNHPLTRLPAFLLLIFSGGNRIHPLQASERPHRPTVSAENPFEPTVTQEESLLLTSALGIARTNHAAAIQSLQIENLDDASPALDFAIGNFHFQMDALEPAGHAYRAALKKLPKFRSAITNLGRVYLLQEKTDAAIRLYQELVIDGQADADILLLLGHALLMEDAPVSAETAYRHALLLRPRHDDTRLGLTKAILLQERLPEGLALLSELLKASPDTAELWSLRANAYVSMEKYEAAIRTIEQARRLSCADGDMLATLGDLLLNRNQPEDALKAYERAFQSERPTVERMLRAVEGFLLVGDAAGAANLMEQIDALRDRSPGSISTQERTRLLRMKANLALLTGDKEEARTRCEQVLRLDPLAPRTLLMLAQLQEDAGELEEASITCERAARVHGFEADALVRHAQLEVRRGRYHRAVTLLEAAQTFEKQAHVARYLEQVRRMAAL